MPGNIGHYQLAGLCGVVRLKKQGEREYEEKIFYPGLCAGVLKKATCLNIVTLLFELGAVFFLVQSMLTVFLKGKSNWYLPLALGLNCVGLFLNTVQQRKNGKNENMR